jgi:hypothetical protein
MWSKKKPDTTHAADPEPINLQPNQPPKPATASGSARDSGLRAVAGSDRACILKIASA